MKYVIKKDGKYYHARKGMGHCPEGWTYHLNGERGGHRPQLFDDSDTAVGFNIRKELGGKVVPIASKYHELEGEMG